MSFSERYGYKEVKKLIQFETMDEDLENSLWNALVRFYWQSMTDEYLSDNPVLQPLFMEIWTDYFKWSLDTLNNHFSTSLKRIREYFFNCKWFEAYDFIEFMANNKSINNKEYREAFILHINNILKREVSAYRFVGTQITKITAEEEIKEIEETLSISGKLKPVSDHINKALSRLSDRKSPDYPNSIKESISAVEAICRLVTGKDKATLGDALKALEQKITLHPALKKAFDSLYGYTSDAEGIRHALLEEASLDFEDAKFMLVACSAFVNYLVEKANKAKIF